MPGFVFSSVVRESALAVFLALGMSVRSAAAAGSSRAAGVAL
jgi:hypothetical protein